MDVLYVRLNDRPVLVDTRWLPTTGIRRDNLAMWIKAGGLHLDHEMPGRQLAWVRRTSLHLSTGQMRSGMALQQMQTQAVSPARSSVSARRSASI